MSQFAAPFEGFDALAAAAKPWIAAKPEAERDDWRFRLLMRAWRLFPDVRARLAPPIHSLPHPYWGWAMALTKLNDETQEVAA